MSAFIDALRYKTERHHGHHGPVEPVIIVEVESSGEATVIETQPKAPFKERMQARFESALKAMRTASRVAWLVLKDFTKGVLLGVGIEGIIKAVALAKGAGWMGLIPLGIAGHNLLPFAVQFSPAVLLVLSILLTAVMVEIIARTVFHRSPLMMLLGVISDLGALLSKAMKYVTYALSQLIVVLLVIVAFIGVGAIMILHRIVTALALLLQTPFMIMGHRELVSKAWKDWFLSWKPELFYTTVRPYFKLVTEPGEDQETEEWSQLLEEPEDKSKTPPKGQPTPKQEKKRPSKPDLTNLGDEMGPEPGPSAA